MAFNVAMSVADAAPTPAIAPARRLRVLVVDEALPYPPDSGKRLRTWHLLRRLARDHDITLLAFASPEPGADARALGALAAAGIEGHTLPAPAAATGARLYARLLLNLFSPWPYSVAKHHSARLREATRVRARDSDLLHIEWTPLASHVDWPGKGAPPHLVSAHNMEARIWSRRAAVTHNPLARAFFHIQAIKMRRFEQLVFRRAGAITTVSADDQHEAQRLGARGAHLVANGVDLNHYQPAPSRPVAGRLLFVGALDWFPNQDAVLHCAQEIMPRIRRHNPAATLEVVGRRPPESLRRRLSGLPGVTLVGAVEDVRPYLAEAAVAVVPLRIGGGSRLKILEALAMEKAVVSTAIGAEGLPLQSGVHAVLADGAASFAAAVLGLLAAPARAAAVGRAGGAWARAHYGWDACAAALDAAWRAAAGQGGGA